MRDSFIHILHGEATESERAKFFKDLEQNPKDYQEFLDLYNVWIINNLSKQRQSKEQTPNFASFWNKKIKKHNYRITKNLIRTAASFALIVGLSTAILLHIQKPKVEMFVLTASKGNIAEVTLKDGSRIWLNSASKAEICSQGEKKIEVNLNGEAYFDIKHNENRKFTVNTGTIVIEDKGTKFNVKAYSPKDAVSVSLFDGNVNISSRQGELFNNLKKNQTLQINLNSSEASIQDASYNDITGWKEGRFVFNNQSLKSITAQLEEWYNVKFTFARTAKVEGCFTGVIQRKTNIRDVLRIIAISNNIKYKVTDNEDGSIEVTFY